MVSQQATLDEKLEEYKKIQNLYDVAITAHQKTISDAKKGKLTFTQISDPKLFGLLAGELKRLNGDRDKIKEEIKQLEEKLTTQPTQEPTVQKTTDSCTSNAIVVNLPHLVTEPQTEKVDETYKEPEAEITTASDFDGVTFTPDLTTPDIFLDREVKDTLGQLGCDIEL